MPMLPHHQRILLQIRHIFVSQRRAQLKEQPPNVRVKQPLINVVGIVVVIHKLMMNAMLAGPHQCRILKRSRPKNQGEKTHRPMPTKSQVREHPMVSQSDRKSTGRQHHEEEPHLEPINPKLPQINRHRRQRQRKSPDQKDYAVN